MINQTAQLKELADGKARSSYNLNRTCCRIEHPARHLEGAALRLPNQEIMSTVVLMVAGHQDRPADQRMVWIDDHGFECQKPGTMAPARTAVPNTGLSSRPWSRLASSTTSIRSPISPTS